MGVDVVGDWFMGCGDVGGVDLDDVVVGVDVFDMV